MDILETSTSLCHGLKSGRSYLPRRCSDRSDLVSRLDETRVKVPVGLSANTISGVHQGAGFEFWSGVCHFAVVLHCPKASDNYPSLCHQWEKCGFSPLLRGLYALADKLANKKESGCPTIRMRPSA